MNSVTKTAIRAVRIYIHAHRQARAIAGREGVHIQDAVSDAINHYYEELYSSDRPERPIPTEISADEIKER